jgi:hypothetical protein
VRIAYRSGFNAGICRLSNSIMSLTPAARAEALGVSVADVHAPWGNGQERYGNALLHWKSGYVDGCAALSHAQETLRIGADAEEACAAITRWLSARGVEVADALLWLCDGATRDEIRALAGEAVFMAQRPNLR